jgi:uncharacterized membrane protein YgcG
MSSKANRAGWRERVQRGPIIVLSIIIIAVIAALVIAYYQSTSTKVVAAQCDKTKKVCQVQRETTHFGGYFPVYSYYYVPFPLYGPGLGLFYPGSFIGSPYVCDNCLNRITPQDEQDVLNSKGPVSQSDLPSEQPSSSSPTSQPENAPSSSESGNPNEQSPPTESPSSPESSSSPGSSGGGESSGGGGGGESGGGGGGESGGAGIGGGGGDEG